MKFLNFLTYFGGNHQILIKSERVPQVIWASPKLWKKVCNTYFFPCKTSCLRVDVQHSKSLHLKLSKLFPLTSSGDVPLSPGRLLNVLCTFNLSPASCEYHSANSCITCYELGLYPTLRYFLIFELTTTEFVSEHSTM